jgi:hypothetical protein
MKPKKRQKLCHNCEGEIDIDVIVCPFCAADLREEKPEQNYSSYISQVQQMNRKEMSTSLYASSSTSSDSVLPSEDTDIPKEKKEEEGKVGIFVPTILFTLGVQLCVIGLLMLLFSHKGVVILKWDARFCFFYLFASVPFLVFGYKFLSRL